MSAPKHVRAQRPERREEDHVAAERAEDRQCRAATNLPWRAAARIHGHTRDRDDEDTQCDPLRHQPRFRDEPDEEYAGRKQQEWSEKRGSGSDVGEQLAHGVTKSYRI